MKPNTAKRKVEKKHGKVFVQPKESESSTKAKGLAERMVRHYKIAGKTKSFGSYNH